MDKALMLQQYTESVENFLKTVYQLQQRTERVSTNALSHALNITAPSVTDMAQRLQENGLVDYRKYRGVRLTPQGERVALQMVRRHRLLELYLVQELGYDLHEVHDEAENLEHAVSERFVEAINRKLKQPHYDPHGDPIPDANGQLPQRTLHRLTDAPIGAYGRVSRLISPDNDMLQHTLDRGFKLGVYLTVTERDPFEGPVTVHVEKQPIIIGYAVASHIMIEILEE